ncbi:MMPL family transporter [Flavobacteriaceae bacterium]|jgi:predicted RND superfamily exporter protein|nr:MMPL family transporter [Flavobacteriaceae bacterium]MDG1723097.1 MMPL family transporter [Flavobacteriaceae bacterium]MDG2290218.1 MMPL family transporter [Flavobacteriaceae bacterium]
MIKWINTRFWESVARLILRNRIVFLLAILGTTFLLSTQWSNIRFSFTEANLLPDNHPFNTFYQEFLDRFGEEGNLIVLAVQDEAFFEPEKLAAWAALGDSLAASPNIENVVDVSRLTQLKRNDRKKVFEVAPLPYQRPKTQAEANALKEWLYKQQPLYDGLLFNQETGVIQTAVYLKTEVVNSGARQQFVDNLLADNVAAFEKQTGLDIRVSGMPYIRTLNAKMILDEIGLFVLMATLVTTLIFFFFFRSYRATFISMSIVVIGVMWAFGIIGLLGFEITVLTALIPPIIIVIGVPNCIFLINKYQNEIKKHGNQARSLQRVISKVGNATLMTNMTTACGFATFTLTNSSLLREFGIVASINIMMIFLLSLLMIPIIYSFMPIPNKKHLEHLNREWISGFVKWMERMVKHRRVSVYFISVLALMLSIVGIYEIRLSGTIIDDMPKKADFYQDIRFFETHFKGVMPIEIMIDTKRANGATRLSTLNRMNRLESDLLEIPELSNPVSAVSVAKYLKQSYYNGNPKYFQLPTRQQDNFIRAHAKNLKGEVNFLKSLVDPTGQFARMTVMLQDVTTERMEAIEMEVKKSIDKHFAADRFNVSITGKALGYLKGTRFLVRNLVVSLGLAILLIALFMAYMFRSFRMILISLLPNVIPLILTAGMMGFLGIAIKPSTILVFSVAFGISVDDTIHFLVKYRQELKATRWNIKKSVYSALRETGVSMFYTSIVLFFGFSVFMISSYGGTVALGGLVSATLLFAMLANLILLPSLLLSLEKQIANENTLKEPKFQILPEKEAE